MMWGPIHLIATSDIQNNEGEETKATEDLTITDQTVATNASETADTETPVDLSKVSLSFCHSPRPHDTSSSSSPSTSMDQQPTTDWLNLLSEATKLLKLLQRYEKRSENANEASFVSHPRSDITHLLKAMIEYCYQSRIPLESLMKRLMTPTMEGRSNTLDSTTDVWGILGFLSFATCFDDVKLATPSIQNELTKWRFHRRKSATQPIESDRYKR